MQLKTLTQTYNDGIAKFYSVENIAAKGDMKKDGLKLKFDKPLCYEEETVGITRFWTASKENSKIERLLRFPRNENVIRNDVVIPIDGKQYRIIQIQYPNGIVPPSMDLSLERLDDDYDIATS